MSSRLRWVVGVALGLGLGLAAPERSSAQVGALGEIVKEKLDKGAEAVAAAGQQSENGKAASKVVGGQPATGSGAATTIIVTVLPISVDILDRLAAALAAEATERDKPAKRARCIARAAQIPSIASLPPAEGAHELIERCGPVIVVADSAYYSGVGSLGGGFTPEQYASLKQRVAPYCEASDSAGEQAGASNFSDTERIALKARCRLLLPSFQRISQ